MVLSNFSEMYFKISLIVLMFSCAAGYSQTPACDSSNVEIKTSRAQEIALDVQYKECYIEKTEFLSENDTCCWKITVADRYAARHHGHYARTYSIIWIDASTGDVLKREAHKRIEGYYEER